MVNHAADSSFSQTRIPICATVRNKLGYCLLCVLRSLITCHLLEIGSLGHYLPTDASGVGTNCGLGGQSVLGVMDQNNLNQ